MMIHSDERSSREDYHYRIDLAILRTRESVQLIIDAFETVGRSGKAAARCMTALGDALAVLVDRSRWRPLSVAGYWAYRSARSLGFAEVDVLAWLEQCPYAFADELAPVKD